MAFQKLLKKYKKWTGSSKLGERFQKEVLNRPGSFSTRDFGPLLTQWTEVLAAVRAPFDAGVHWHAVWPRAMGSDQISSGDSSSRPISEGGDGNSAGKDAYTGSAADLYTRAQQGSVSDFDTVLAISSSGRGGGKASYWVHPDNLVELHVLLLQYTGLRNPITPISSGRSSNSRSSPISYTDGGRALSSAQMGDEIGVFICDDLQWFARSRSSATVSESPDQAAASIRFSLGGEAVIVAEAPWQDDARLESHKTYHVHKTKLKKKVLRQYFGFHQLPRARRNSNSSIKSNADACTSEEQIFDDLQAWYAQRREVKPLVQIQMRRTRFVGLGNTQSAGVWATLDRDIKMRKCLVDALGSHEDVTNLNERGIPAVNEFPHAVLDMRYEGEEGAAVVAVLDGSHLTERIHGFSLETHAVATLCQPAGMASPFWLPVLDRDLRKLPAPIKSRNRRGLNRSIIQTDSTGRTSESAPSTADGPTGSGFSGLLVDSPGTSASEGLGRVDGFEKKRKFRSRREHPLRIETNFESPPRQPRYWNEFDDGDETSSEEAYMIYVDPQADRQVPGAALAASLRAKVQTWGKKTTAWLRAAPQSSSTSPSSPDGLREDEPDLERNYQTCSHAQTERHHSTVHAASSTHAMLGPHGGRHKSLRPHASMASLITSVTSLLIATVLATISYQTDTRSNAALCIGVIMCVVASFAFGLLGLGISGNANIPRRRNWIWMGTVGLIFAMECLCGVALLVVVLSNG